jgi:hypothetical protein
VLPTFNVFTSFGGWAMERLETNKIPDTSSNKKLIMPKNVTDLFRIIFPSFFKILYLKPCLLRL